MIDYDELKQFKETKNLLCLCKKGIRSYTAATLLRLAGFKCCNIYGGIDDLKGVKGIPFA